VLVFEPPFDEVIQSSIPPAQEEENVVSHFPFQILNDALFHDEEVLEEALDALDPSCYDEGDDMIGNIDDFIHVGRHKWDVVGHDGDPIYNIEGHFQFFPLQQSYVIATDFDFL
jgi:hypothetical protein